MEKTYSFTFEVGQEYTNGCDTVKIIGFTDESVIVNDGRNFDFHIEVKELITQWWEVEY
jgi:hypothetical protein